LSVLGRDDKLPGLEGDPISTLKLLQNLLCLALSRSYDPRELVQK
jgi:hypothetical protein